MSLFNKSSKKKLESIQVSKIKFLSEQDGIPERELKNKFIELFKKNNNIKSAYLARVSYGKWDSFSVALCIRTIIDPEHQFIEDIGKIFSDMFGTKEHMDIIILNEKQEIEISMNCKPFFESSV